MEIDVKMKLKMEVEIKVSPTINANKLDWLELRCNVLSFM